MRNKEFCSTLKTTPLLWREPPGSQSPGCTTWHIHTAMQVAGHRNIHCNNSYLHCLGKSWGICFCFEAVLGGGPGIQNRTEIPHTPLPTPRFWSRITATLCGWLKHVGGGVHEISASPSFILPWLLWLFFFSLQKSHAISPEYRPQVLLLPTTF